METILKSKTVGVLDNQKTLMICDLLSCLDRQTPTMSTLRVLLVRANKVPRRQHF